MVFNRVASEDHFESSTSVVQLPLLARPRYFTTILIIYSTDICINIYNYIVQIDTILLTHTDMLLQRIIGNLVKVVPQ